MNTHHCDYLLSSSFEGINSYDPDETKDIVVGVYYPKEKKRNCTRKKKHGHKRAVFKNGEFNVEKYNSRKSSIGVISDWFINIVEARWRWTLLSFAMGFLLDWLLFGFIYWLIALDHEDLTEENLPPYQNVTRWTPCIEEIYGFTSTFLFSIEVHTTVAYGRRSITLECPQAILAMCLQCIVSSIVQAFMVGILFAKLTRPKARTHTVLFSRNAVVSQRDEQLCLSFRVGDVRKSKIVNLKTAAYLLIKQEDEEGKNTFEQINLNVVIDGCDSIFFLWPVSVVHTIDEESPLYNLSAIDILCGSFEILVVVEGTIESTGQPLQARSSYSAKEIMWGYRFLSMVEIDETEKYYIVDFSKLSETEQVDTPLCSAQELKFYRSMLPKYIDKYI